jgi:hypothetical protein
MAYVLTGSGLLLRGAETAGDLEIVTLACGILQELCDTAGEYRVDAVLRAVRIYLRRQ